ncbi:5-formyltetrahydrofolate cyclo-ligase [Sulfitobacter sabulilitoris]|uniref:5-formyltetrahydrofolate cyclo-ligase n=1 Tax=Sulfitobacter sabulilitoris TaxID=2562655 RepID=A0A5S3PDE3_9RHOB|nr:5-formyltetrahydrofolate cyclo-ligase [Sulfitobacter sabulilitoris]TMM51877.1 5-formyltetrahydrofolate cyclo-ligase [Sulfitobacter sabulilitoris]
MSPLALRKSAARAAALDRRRLAHAAASRDTAAGVLSEVLAGYRGVPVSGYMPMRCEIDPLPAMAEAAAHGPVGVPVIMAKASPLQFARWEPDMPMVTGTFGAQVPAAPEFFEPELLIVPLMAFDRAGGRLGYGGGFYDRTLELLRARRPTLAIGFAFAAQEMDDLPQEATDQLLDMIVTESGVIEIDRTSAKG